MNRLDWLGGSEDWVLAGRSGCLEGSSRIRWFPLSETPDVEPVDVAACFELDDGESRAGSLLANQPPIWEPCHHNLKDALRDVRTGWDSIAFSWAVRECQGTCLG